MAIKRVVDTGFWTDDKVVELFSPEDKLFMLYLLTNPHTTQLGIYKTNKKIMAFELGYSLDTINVLLDRFETKYKIIIYDKETNEIAIKNYLKYSIIKGGKPVEDCLTRDIQQVKNKKLISYVFNNIKDCTNINETIKKIINIYNDNDNEVSYHDTPNDTYHDTKTKRFIKPTIDEIQEYCNERNNGINAIAFYDFYESKDWYVGKNKMKDWKACIRTWEQRNTKTKTTVPDWLNKEIKDEEMSEDAKRIYKEITGNDYK